MNTSYSFAIEVTPSDCCYLQEALYWVAFGRLPYEDSRSFLYDAARSDDYKTYFPFLDGRLEDEEAELAGIYADPRSHWCMPISMMISDSFETVLDRRSRWGQDNDEENQTDYQEKTRKIYDDLQEWAKLDFEKAIEFPAAKLFVALREGLIETWGKLLPDTDVATALKSIQDTGKTLEGLDYVKILPEFWSLQSIYWEESAARNDTQHFCQIHCRTHEVLKAFPLDKLARAPLYNVEKCGSFLIINNGGDSSRRPRKSPRQVPLGRPREFDWDELHYFVGRLARAGKLPEKKDAAASAVSEHFEKTGRRSPGRTAILQKLKPYYEPESDTKSPG